MPVLIGGSVHRGEDRALLSVYRSLVETGRELHLIIVPRYPADAATVIGELDDLGLAGVRKTELETGNAPLAANQVIVVDTMGELRRFYTMSDIAYVGGSLHYRGSNKGGHNLMEPAVLGLAVLFGPYNYSFRETVRALLAAGGGAQVRDEDELRAELGKLLDDPSFRAEMGRRARLVVLDSRGAAGQNLQLLRDYLPADTTPRDSTSNQGIPSSHETSQTC